MFNLMAEALLLVDLIMEGVFWSSVGQRVCRTDLDIPLLI